MYCIVKLILNNRFLSTYKSIPLEMALDVHYGSFQAEYTRSRLKNL